MDCKKKFGKTILIKQETNQLKYTKILKRSLNFVCDFIYENI